jgi:hypothetical protein
MTQSSKAASSQFVMNWVCVLCLLMWTTIGAIANCASLKRAVHVMVNAQDPRNCFHSLRCMNLAACTCLLRKIQIIALTTVKRLTFKRLEMDENLQQTCNMNLRLGNRMDVPFLSCCTPGVRNRVSAIMDRAKNARNFWTIPDSIVRTLALTQKETVVSPYVVSICGLAMSTSGLVSLCSNSLRVMDIGYIGNVKGTLTGNRWPATDRWYQIRSVAPSSGRN